MNNDENDNELKLKKQSETVQYTKIENKRITKIGSTPGKQKQVNSMASNKNNDN